MKLKNRKIYFVLLLLVIITVTLLGILWLVLRDDPDSTVNSENDTEENSNLESLTPEEALNKDYVVYYTSEILVVGSREIQIEGAFSEDYWISHPDAYGIMFSSGCSKSTLCYWIPVNSGIVESNESKKIKLALEEMSIIRQGEVQVIEYNDEFEVRINEMASLSEIVYSGEVESVIKTIELYTKNYEIYYQGEKGFDKFYDTAFPKGG